jgi:2-dehydro-3-deoxyphosphogluconate aldolase/(4S)-4-hydroxy-2-oxoglutarate aldolase
MARFKRLDVLNKMVELGLVPVFYEPNLDTAMKIVKACYDGGARVIEMTNRGDGAIHIFRELEIYCKKELPEVILGVGSIVDAPTAAMYIADGSNFVVGPVLDKDTAYLCNSRKIPYIPGCGSATEIHEAERLGVEICKIFPGKEVGGPAFVSSVKGPCPWTMIMPTGGVDSTEESVTAWFNAGVSCVGMGSKLVTKEFVQKKDFSAIKENVEKVLEYIKNVKKGSK